MDQRPCSMKSHLPFPCWIKPHWSSSSSCPWQANATRSWLKHVPACPSHGFLDHLHPLQGSILISKKLLSLVPLCFWSSYGRLLHQHSPWPFSGSLPCQHEAPLQEDYISKTSKAQQATRLPFILVAIRAPVSRSQVSSPAIWGHHDAQTMLSGDEDLKWHSMFPWMFQWIFAWGRKLSKREFEQIYGNDSDKLPNARSGAQACSVPLLRAFNWMYHDASAWVHISTNQHPFDAKLVVACAFVRSEQDLRSHDGRIPQCMLWGFECVSVLLPRFKCQ